MPGTSSIRVFVSYRREDTAGHAGRLYDNLVARLGPGAHVFMDVDDIEPGVDFTEVLHDAVSSCDVMLALIGSRWTTAAAADGSRRIDDPSDYLVNEIGAALERNVRVIPILVDGAPMPAVAELPDRLKSLVRRNAMWLRTTTWRPDAESIFEVLDRIRTAPATAVPPPTADPGPPAPTPPAAAAPPPAPTPPPVTPPPPAPAPRGSKKTLWIALGALAAVIVVVGVISVLASSGGSSSASSGDASSSTDTGFRFAPASGPIGTNIRVKSSEPCPDPPSGWSDVAVEVVLHDPRVEEQTLDGDVNATDLTLNSDRSWDGEISVPDGATEGTLELRASCLGTDPAGNLSAFHEYDSQYFELAS